MLISTCGAAKSIAAANCETLIVLPKRRGVEICGAAVLVLLQGADIIIAQETGKHRRINKTRVQDAPAPPAPGGPSCFRAAPAGGRAQRPRRARSSRRSGCRLSAWAYIRDIAQMQSGFMQCRALYSLGRTLPRKNVKSSTKKLNQRGMIRYWKCKKTLYKL